MNVLYRWKLTIGESTQQVHPIYKDDLSLDYQRETGQMFYRAKLSGKITFVAVDADIIINAPFETEYIVTIEKSVDMGLTWTEYYRCHFYKTDCTINEDDRSVEVQPAVIDQYNDVLNGLEKEYDLMQLGVAVQAINMARRPMFQVYVHGETIVSCLCGGNYFETDKKNDDRTPEACHFSKIGDSIEIQFETRPSMETPFFGIMKDLETHPKNFYNLEGVYYLQYWAFREEGQEGLYWNGLDVIRMSDNETLWEYEQSNYGSGTNDYVPLPSSMTFHPAEGHTELTNIEATLLSNSVYGRFVTDMESFIDPVGGSQVDCFEIDDDDIATDNRNYRYCIGYTDFDLTQDARTQTDPTKWGKAANGKYFITPNQVDAWYPVGQSLWNNSSLWIDYHSDMAAWELAGTTYYDLKDAYPISSVIKVLLAQFAPSVTHEDAAAYSTMMYDDSVASGLASLLNGTRCYVSPKSNVLIGEYQEPAQKAPCTLKSVFDMLKNVYGCYWYIDSSNRLCIEHLQWFKNGGSYSNAPSIGYDLTMLENLPNGKKWAFATSQYQFDKEDMPTRYQYEWMDDVTQLFKGSPINVVSKFVKEDKVEEINISNFTSDIDMMQLAPEKFSKDGFALLQAANVGSFWQLPTQTFTVGVYTYKLQNYIVAMIYAQRSFLLYDMPAWTVEIDDVQLTSSGIQRNKKQQLSFPVGVDDPNVQQLVKTYLGNGQIDKMNVYLSSRTAKVTLKYNTYDNE